MTVTKNTAKPKSSLPERRYTPFRLTLTGLKLIDGLATKKGISRASVVEWALREMAEKYGVTV